MSVESALQQRLSDAPPLRAVVAGLRDRPLDDAAALAVRLSVFGPDGVVSADEVKALVELDARSDGGSPAWRVLFQEALADALVRQASPEGYVSDAQAEWLIDLLTHVEGGFRERWVNALLHLLETAYAAPASLSAFALRACVRDVIRPDAAGASPRISAEEAVLLRRVLHATGGASGLGTSREEAEALFDINDACRGGDNAPEWTEVFVQGVAQALLSAGGPAAPDVADVRRHEAWLAQRGGGFSFASLFRTPIGESLHAALTPFTDIATLWAERNVEISAAERSAHELTDGEFDWLTSRIGRDGVQDPNEAALIRFVMADAAEPAAGDPPRTTFGRRTPSAA